MSARPVDTIEKWGVFDLAIPGASDEAGPAPVAWFRNAGRERFAAGCRAPDGTHRVSFMPDAEGVWTYAVSAGDSGAVLASGEFACGPPSPGNHGPVRVADGTRLRYADGTPYDCLGTTAYRWHLQGDRSRARTLRALRAAPFTKVRMVVPAATTGQPLAAALADLDRCVGELGALGLEAELVLFDPDETPEALGTAGSGDWRERVRQVVSRLGARRNVWWCVASDPDRFDVPGHVWDEALRLVCEYDYGRHLRSLHAGVAFDFGRPPITHVSLRHEEVRAASALVRDHGKPVVVDSCGREGDGSRPLDSLPATELTVRFWEGACRGASVTHGEFYGAGARKPWSEAGGDLVGDSVARVAFLARILAEVPPGARHDPFYYDASTLDVPGEYYLQYLGPHRFRHRHFALPEGAYRVELIDTWNMTIREVAGTFGSEFTVEAPGELYQALRIRRMSTCAP